MEAIFETRGLWFFVLLAGVFYCGYLYGIKKISDRLFIFKTLDKDLIPEFANNLIEEAQNKIDIYFFVALVVIAFSSWMLF